MLTLNGVIARRRQRLQPDQGRSGAPCSARRVTASPSTGALRSNGNTLARGFNGASAAPVFTGTTTTINNGGMISLLNNGTGNNSLISYANTIAINEQSGRGQLEHRQQRRQHQQHDRSRGSEPERRPGAAT